MIEKISQDILSACGRGIAQGKKHWDILVRENSALGSFTGEYLQPDFRHVCTDFRHVCTDFAISRNLLRIPHVKVTTERNVRNYSFLQIETDYFFMTTSHVKQDTDVPRHALFRCDRAMSNDPFLFAELEEQRPTGKPYLILVHGLIEKKKEGHVVYELLFGGIGMPCGDMPTRWNEYLPLADYIDLASNIPEETIDEPDPGLLKLKQNFAGDADNNDSA